MSFDANVAVLGLGTMGANALWRLAERGEDVLGIERFEPGHAFGSAHGGTRLFRMICKEHPGLVPIARRAAKLWRELETRSGQRLFEQTGGLTIGAPDSELITATRRVAEANGIELTTIDPREEFPQHSPLPAGHIGLRDEQAGVLRPERAITAACRAAEAAGARTMFGTRVTAIEPDEHGVLIRTEARALRVCQVVVTTGAWLPEFAPSLPLAPLRTPQTWFAPRGETDEFALERFPTFVRAFEDGSTMWGHGGVDGADPKCGPASNPANPRIKPDEIDRTVTPRDWELIGSMVAKGFEGLNPEPSEVNICMYTKTSDEQFVLGRVGERVLLGGGGSGHAFKHGPALGEVLAELATGSAPFTDVSFLDPNRFH